MTHETFVAQQKLRVRHTIVADSCNKSRNKNMNRDQLYFSATCWENAECRLVNFCLRLVVSVT